MLRDTLKYSREDIYHTPIGTQNKNQYSELFIINGKQYFKFDIVSGKCTKEFITEYLEKPKLISIDKLSLLQSQALYGTSGEKGATVIWIKNLKTLENGKLWI